jgi:hypothetical protein
VEGHARTRIRSLARSLAASGPALETVDPPEPDELARGDETAALSGDTVEVEEIEGRSAASDPRSEHPAPVEGEDARGSAWHEAGFETPEQLYEQFTHVDRLRGRQANELGRLRRQVGLYERSVRLLLTTRDPFERQALLQAIGLIHEPRVWPAVEEMLDVGEQAYEPEVSLAV